jgi:hypothetical protein
MEVFYDIVIENDEGTHTCRFPIKAIRWLLFHSPVNFYFSGIVVDVLNSMAFDPIADTTVGEIRTFFTEMCQHWLDLHLEPLTEFPPRVSFAMP